jgi:hypothetical protein
LDEARKVIENLKKSILFKGLFESQRTKAKRSETMRRKILWNSSRNRVNFEIGQRALTVTTVI